MSRRYNQSKEVNKKVTEILRDPAFMGAIFKTKPRWMPKFLWKIVVGFVIKA